jgi:anti-sigma regulatory factor (Ser/Thr protein kinase)
MMYSVGPDDRHYGNSGSRSPREAEVDLGGRRSKSWPLSWGAEAACQARRAIRLELSSSGVPAELMGTAELLVSELVANAVRHAAAPLSLSVVQTRMIRCSVEDGSAVLPKMRSSGGQDECGRGLALVDELSHRWGSYPSTHGKTTWFELEVSPGDRRP